MASSPREERMKGQHVRRTAVIFLITSILGSASSASAGGGPTQPGRAAESWRLVVPEGDQVFRTSDSQFYPGVDNQGWWSPTASNYDGNENYIVGQASAIVGQASAAKYRNFFTFDVSSLQGTVVSASLLLTCFQPLSPQPSEIYALSHVNTPPEVLNRNKGTSAEIYGDLGDGTYGAHSVTLASDCPELRAILDLPLNDAAVADINAASQWFSIGGKLVTAFGDTDQYLFGRSSSSGMGLQALVVQTK